MNSDDVDALVGAVHLLVIVTAAGLTAFALVPYKCLGPKGAGKLAKGPKCGATMKVGAHASGMKMDCAACETEFSPWRRSSDPFGGMHAGSTR